jgi:hypothetical protein
MVAPGTEAQAKIITIMVLTASSRALRSALRDLSLLSTDSYYSRESLQRLFQQR